MSESEKQSKSRPAPKSAWKAGQSGNPAGRPKSPESAAEVLRAKMPPEQRAQALVDLALTAEDENVRLRALLAIWDRTDGKVRETVDLNHGGPTPEQQAFLEALRMTPEERRKKLAEPDQDADD